LNNNIDKRCEEIGGYLRDQEKSFKLENRSELHHIASVREKKQKKIGTSCFRFEKNLMMRKKRGL
jgi:hypothetical protein